MDLTATILGSALAGMLARIPCHPLDTVKSRLQAARGPLSGGSATSASPNGILSTLRSAVKTEGIRGLYRGFGIAFWGSAPGTCLYFTSYEVAKSTLSSTFPSLAAAPALGHFAAGMTAEAVSCIFWVPIDVVKERMQVQRRLPLHSAAAGAPPLYYRNTLDAFRKISASEGILGLYRGYGATIASFGPFSALYFMFYERFKGIAQRQVLSTATSSRKPSDPDVPLPLALQILTASAAGSAASLVTNPLDLAKLRLQVQRGAAAAGGAAASAAASSSATAAGGSGSSTPAPTAYRHTAHALATIVREEGPRALFRGAAARVAFHAPSTAITMTLFEQCKALITRLMGTHGAGGSASVEA